MATISSRLDENGNWITIQAATSGAFSKSAGGEASSPTTAFERSLTLIDSVNTQLHRAMTSPGAVSVAYGVKIAPTGEVMLSGSTNDCQFRVTFTQGTS